MKFEKAQEIARYLAKFEDLNTLHKLMVKKNKTKNDEKLIKEISEKRYPGFTPDARRVHNGLMTCYKIIQKA